MKSFVTVSIWILFLAVSLVYERNDNEISFG